MHGKRGIVIAGMHGKDDDVRDDGARVSARAGCIRRIMSARRFRSSAANAHWNPRGEYFVAEGDESDGTIRFFHPEHALILNIEEEHLDFYADLAAIDAVFSQLLDQTSGNVFYCADDANARRALREAGRARSRSALRRTPTTAESTSS